MLVLFFYFLFLFHFYFILFFRVSAFAMGLIFPSLFVCFDVKVLRSLRGVYIRSKIRTSRALYLILQVIIRISFSIFVLNFAKYFLPVTEIVFSSFDL